MVEVLITSTVNNIVFSKEQSMCVDGTLVLTGLWSVSLAVSVLAHNLNKGNKSEQNEQP